MKSKLVLLFCFLIISGSGYSQEKYASYFISFIDKEFDIAVSFEEDGFTLFIDGVGGVNRKQKGGLMIDSKFYPGFMENLKTARSKYEEWTRVAIENDVKEFRKEVALEAEPVAGYSVLAYDSTWSFYNSVRPTFIFSVFENADGSGTVYLMSIRTGELIDSANERYTNPGFALAFSSIQEFDDFLDSVSLEKIQEFKSMSASKDHLFKDN